MKMDGEPIEEAPARRRWLPPALLGAVIFLAGVLTTAWIVTSWSAAPRLLGLAPAPQQPLAAVPAPTLPAAEQLPAAAPGTLVIDPETSRRVNALEQRLNELDQSTRSAIGNADRAEGLLVAFATRRAMDRGVPLGFLETLLRQRFATSQPAAVATVITAARDPVTLQDLQEGLQNVSADLTGSGPNRSWWEAFRHEIGNLASIRRAGTPSTLPAERLDRARARLEAGQVDVALAEVMRLPGRERATLWVSEAQRYVSARRALDALETAALLEPRVSTQTSQVAAAQPRRRS